MYLDNTQQTQTYEVLQAAGSNVLSVDKDSFSVCCVDDRPCATVCHLAHKQHKHLAASRRLVFGQPAQINIKPAKKVLLCSLCCDA